MDSIIRTALREDVGRGDITTRLTVPAKTAAEALMIAKEDGIIFGLEAAKEVFRTLDRSVKFSARVKEGSRVEKGTVLAKIKGPAAAILTGERTALNFVQRLSGVATAAGQYASKLKGTKARLLDTRKTTPGLRALEKNAVKAGGGTNHRMGLYDAVLIKDNHIALAGGVKAALKKAKAGTKLPVEIEVEIMRQLQEALDGGADRILLDNMTIGRLKKAVSAVKKWNNIRRKKVTTEASGGINLSNIRQVALTGVDFISTGAVTHSAQALDISLEIK